MGSISYSDEEMHYDGGQGPHKYTRFILSIGCSDKYGGHSLKHLESV